MSSALSSKPNDSILETTNFVKFGRLTATRSCPPVILNAYATARKTPYGDNGIVKVGVEKVSVGTGSDIAEDTESCVPETGNLRKCKLVESFGDQWELMG